MLQVTATFERHPYGAAAQRQTQNVHRSPKKAPCPLCHTCHRDEPNWLRASQQHEEAGRDNRRDGASAPWRTPLQVESRHGACVGLSYPPRHTLQYRRNTRKHPLLSGEILIGSFGVANLPTCASRVPLYSSYQVLVPRLMETSAR